MPLGDSITAGVGDPDGGGYRTALLSKLTGGGVSADFVGSQSSGAGGLPDKNHEGHPYWRIGDVAGPIDGWLDTYRPQIVLLHIGTNDMWQNLDQVSNAPNRLGALIDQITSRSPTTQVIVAKITPVANSTTNQRTATYNAAIPNIVSARAAQGKKVTLVDMSSAVATSDLSDGVHPNQTGYSKMADVWYPAILNALATSSVPGSPPPANMLTNGEFESGTANWASWGGSSTTVSDAHSGAALRVGTGAGGMAQAVSGYTAGSPYTLCAWGKVSTAGANAYVGAKDSVSSTWEFAISFTETAYTYKCVDFTLPGNPNAFTVYVWNSGAGSAYADGVMLKRAQNLLYNPGFESDLYWWSDWGNSMASGGAHTGNLAMQVGTGAGGRGQDVTAYVAGASYTFCAWGNVGATGETGYAGVRDNGSNTWSYSVAFTETSYTYKCIVFTPPANTTLLRPYLWKDTGSSYLYADDLRLFVN